MRDTLWDISVALGETIFAIMMIISVLSLVYVVTRYWAGAKVRFKIEPRDMWIGVYVDVEARRAYVCPLPMVLFIIGD